MFGINRPRPATDLDRQPEPSPLTVRMRHIDIELTKLAGQPRTENVRQALDHWLDRRLQMRSAAHDGRRYCEICKEEIKPGEVVADQPGTGGLVQHAYCPGGAW